MKKHIKKMTSIMNKKLLILARQPQTYIITNYIKLNMNEYENLYPLRQVFEWLEGGSEVR